MTGTRNDFALPERLSRAITDGYGLALADLTRAAGAVEGRHHYRKQPGKYRESASATVCTFR